MAGLPNRSRYATVPLFRQVAVIVAVLLTVVLTGPPVAAYAAVGPVRTTAQGIRATIGLPAGDLPLTLHTPQATWQTGDVAQPRTTASAGPGVPIAGPALLGAGAIRAVAAPQTRGGRSAAAVAGLNVLGAGTLTVDAVATTCRMTADGITGDTDVADLRVAGVAVDPGPGTAISVPGVLTGIVDREIASYDTSTGRLTYTRRAIDLTLLGGLAVVASGSVVVAESTCSGIVRLDDPAVSGRTVVPGRSGTPTVTVANTGDVAAPNTVITIPAPPAGYTVGEVTTTGGGECTTTAGQIRCAGVTVPGAAGVTVSVPVTLASSAAGADDWAPGPSAITARSTPIASATGTTLSTSGGGTLVTAGAPQSTGGSFTVAPVMLAAGKDATPTIRLTNNGPSDATTTVTVPIGNRPAGISVVSAAVGGDACTVTATAVTCTGVRVPAGDDAALTVRVAATGTTPPGTTWDLAGLSATLNGAEVAGGGRLLTGSDPEVEPTGSVTVAPATVAPATAVPGGPAATPAVRVADIGIVPVTVTVPPPGRIGTTGAQGDTVHDVATAPPTTAGAADGDDGGEPTPTPAPAVPDDNSDNGGNGADNLPLTGQNIIALVVLSVLLVVGGVLARLVAGDRPRSDPREAV